jgi:malate dehydrogenase (oxaloacetate-decarboxylating)(NADP+)
VQRLGGADAIGPLLMGMCKPVNVLQHGMTVPEIVNVAAITAVSADFQVKETAKKAKKATVQS